MEHTVPIATLAPNVWHHKVLALDLVAKTYSLEIDGAVATAGACYFPSIGPGTAIVSAGLGYASGPTIGESMYVDNIVLTAE
jgi:hypothetical protein